MVDFLVVGSGYVIVSQNFINAVDTSIAVFTAIGNTTPGFRLDLEIIPFPVAGIHTFVGVVKFFTVKRPGATEFINRRKQIEYYQHANQDDQHQKNGLEQEAEYFCHANLGLKVTLLDCLFDMRRICRRLFFLKEFPVTGICEFYRFF